MILLHPTPQTALDCPYCAVPLKSRGWYMPGMRTLADLTCAQCGRAFYGDLPAGHGLYYAMLLEQETGKVHDAHGVPWFADWLASSYAARTRAPMDFAEEKLRPLRRPVLLNCLDYLYGHSLLKLLNAQAILDRQPDLDLVILVPRFLRWMVPSGAAAIWTVDLPLRRGNEWNDWLAEEIARRVGKGAEWMLSVARAHPHPDDFDIARFTGVEPFPLRDWNKTRPTVTFIWRDDRVWDAPLPAGRWKRLPRRAGRKLGLLPRPLAAQARRVVRTADVLRRRFPDLDFAVAGPGRPGGLPAQIGDLRTADLSEHTERAWCRRYAQSQIVLGVHGSNLLLPSAHAGSVIDLMPEDRWGNLAQDILPNASDVREGLCRCRFLPLTSGADTVAAVAGALLTDLEDTLSKFRRPASSPAYTDISSSA